MKNSRIPITGLLSAEFLSLLGNQVAAVALPKLILEYTNSNAITGIAVAGNTIPFVVAAFIGGRAINRFGAWQVSVIADLLSFISVLALPLAFIIYRGHISVVAIFSLVFVGALFDPTGVAARHTLVPGFVRFARKRPDTINTLRGGLESAADLLGPSIGVALIILIGINNTFFANALSFLFCAVIFIVTIPRRRKRSKSKENSGTDLLSGVRFIFKDEKLRTLAITGIVSGFVISSFLGLLLPVLFKRQYHNYAWYGISMSAFGISATLSAFSFAKLNRLFSHSMIYYGGLFTMGIGIILSGIVTVPSAVVAALAFAGLAGAGNPLEQTILQEQTPERISGQVFAALPAIRFAAGSVGLVASGYLTTFFSVTSVLILSGGLLLITAISGWLIAPLKNKY